jgi:DNA-binding IclR family transcriptional regulator
MQSNKDNETKGKRKRTAADNRAYIVPAVDKAARILSLLKSEGREMTIAEISEATGWHKSSVHKLLVTLNYHGLLDRDEATKRYSLGVALSEYGRIALSGLDIRYAAKSFLKTLVEYSGETAALAILRGTKITIVDVELPQNLTRVSLTLGMVAPATTTSNGKAVLAFLPENQLNEIIRTEGLPERTKKSITKIGAYQRDLAAIRERGYATDFEEFQEGIVAVSAPIFDSRSLPMGALSIAGPAFRMTKKKIGHYGQKCAETAAQLSALQR